MVKNSKIFNFIETLPLLLFMCFKVMQDENFKELTLTDFLRLFILLAILGAFIRFILFGVRRVWE
jgi:trans-2-enoyl-CoA reductase